MRKSALVSLALLAICFTGLGSVLPSLASSIKVQNGSPAQPEIIAEGWSKTWGGSGKDASHHMVLDASGNVFIAGEFAGLIDFNPDPVKTDWHSSNNGTTDAFLCKFSADGIFQWAKTWGGGPAGGTGMVGRDVPNGLGVDSAGNVYVTGPFQYTVDFNPAPAKMDNRTSNSGASNNIFLSKFAPDGTFRWVRAWGPSDAGGESYSLVIDSSDHIYVVGDFSGKSTTAIDFDPDPVKTDLHFNHPADPATGITFFDSFLSKFDSNGNLEWAETWGGEGYDDGPGVGLDGSGNVYVTGMYGSKNINFDPDGGAEGLNHPSTEGGAKVDVFLSKFTSTGDFQWVRTWGGTGDDVGEAVLVDEANNIYLGGRFACTDCVLNPGGPAAFHSNGALDAFLMEYDADGNLAWVRTWGGSGDTENDAIGGLVMDEQNNLYATGLFAGTVAFDSGTNTVTSKGLSDAFLIKFSPDGAYQWVQTWGGAGDDWGYYLAVRAGRYYVAGAYADTVDFDPGSGSDSHTSNGGQDAYVVRFLSWTDFLHIPVIVK
jgi:hypothetical protein